MDCGADISSCKQYRYRLWRAWGFGDQVLWIMLNPSTADSRVNDPTIRRCINFTKAWGCDGFEVVNLYALRATNPRELKNHHNPYGPTGGRALKKALNDAWRHVIVAWGAATALKRDELEEREQAILRWVPEGTVLQCLGITKMGHPRHPLYVPNAQPLEPWPSQP